MSGKGDKLRGRVKQAAGDLTDDEELKEEGERDEAAGKMKDAVDTARNKVNHAIDEVRRKAD
jgi:uncharacterized protein YjbJ (UPF0337 family)